MFSSSTNPATTRPKYGTLTLHFHLDGSPHPAYPYTFTLPPPASLQSLYNEILFQAGSLLNVSDVEGIYTSVGGYGIYLVSGFADGGTYAVRPTADCAMSMALNMQPPKSDKSKPDEDAITGKGMFPAYPIVDDGFKAKVDLDAALAEFTAEGHGAYIPAMPTTQKNFSTEPDPDLINLGGLDIGEAYESSWRKRLVARGKKNDQRRREGLPPVYDSDDDPLDGQSSASDDDIDRGDKVVMIKSTTTGFYDVYKRGYMADEDPKWYGRYGDAGSVLKFDISDVTAVDEETGRIYGDILAGLRNERGRNKMSAGEIIEAMKDGMKMALKDPSVQLGDKIVPPAGKTVGLGGTHETGTEGGWSSIAVYGLRALAAVTKFKVEQSEEAFANKGHVLVLAAMKDHPRNPDIGRWGCVCLSNMCSKATQSTLAKVGVIEVACERLGVNADDGDVCGAALILLYKMCLGGFYVSCEKVVDSKNRGVELGCSALKRFTGMWEVSTYLVWLFRELVAGKMSEEVRKGGGVFACSLVKCRWYDNEQLMEDAGAVEDLLCNELDPHSVDGVYYLKQRDAGRAVGGGSMNDVEAMSVLDRNPFAKGNGEVFVPSKHAHRHHGPGAASREGSRRGSTRSKSKQARKRGGDV
jgi:hypothetical protein